MRMGPPKSKHTVPADAGVGARGVAGRSAVPARQDGRSLTRTKGTMQYGFSAFEETPPVDFTSSPVRVLAAAFGRTTPSYSRTAPRSTTRAAMPT
jgi:hypothetical protein